MFLCNQVPQLLALVEDKYKQRNYLNQFKINFKNWIFTN